MSFGARALIRLGALKHNLEVIRSAAPTAKIMAVIKANAYGHGLVAVAENLQDVDALAVARVPEAITLREHGISTRIVLLAGIIDVEELQAVIDWQLEPVIHGFEQVELLESMRGDSISVWLKFDTGMNRLGFSTENATELIERVHGIATISDVSLMTHLASADDLDSDVTCGQLRKFEEITAGFHGDVSIGNSAGALGWPAVTESPHSANKNIWLRPGIALFGISPFADKTGVELGLRPVMQFEARLIAVKSLLAGALVGYKGSYQCDSDTLLGVISAGYGDGYSRHFRDGTPVLINGRIAPVLGHVSMDMIAVDLGLDANDKVGDIATLWGDELPVEAVAPWANAIPYELVCGVMNREESELIS